MSPGVATTEVPTGNTFDKYGSSNPSHYLKGK